MKHITIILAMMACMCNIQHVQADGLFTKTKSPAYYDQNVREHFKKNRWSEGKKLLDEAWKSYGDQSVMNELMGRYYFHFRQYDKSRFYLVRALRDDNTNTAAREMLVKVEEDTHNYSSAICYINELLERNPYSRGWWRRKINIYRKLGNNVEANRLLVRLHQIYPNDSVVKKDVAYLNEQQLVKLKRSGDFNSMTETLQNLIKAYPGNEDYYLQLVNNLLKGGRDTEAAEVAGKGAHITRSTTLMRKRANILSGQGKYTEAINYLNECSRSYNMPALTGLINNIEEEAAESAKRNDPYTAAQMLYAKQHSSEALNYLINTSIARGYYDDALNYITEAKGKGTASNDLMYKEFIVQRRLGNRQASFGLLTKLHESDPKNEEVTEYLTVMRYENASEMMTAQQYNEAIPELIFVQENATDQETKKSAMLRLFNCYLDSKRYEQALVQLDAMLREFGYEHYLTQRALTLHTMGRVEDALDVLQYAYDNEQDAHKASVIAYQYGEYAIPHVKGMIESGMTRAADKAVKRALLVCPTSVDLLHQAITTSDLLGHKDDYKEMVMAGREKYPEDPFFIIKEADLINEEGNHLAAVDMLHPHLNTYMGDSAMTRAFGEYSRQLALDLTKKKAYNKAIETLDTALIYNHANNELLYTKGWVYERMKNYDSAYVYQNKYKPTLMDFQEHKRHLEELQGRNFRNEVTITYQQARPSEDVISANAYASYKRKNTYNDYTLTLGYAGRDGNSKEDMTSDDMEQGGTGVQIGADWDHRFGQSRWSAGIGGAFATMYFPKVTVKGYVKRDMGRDWALDLHASYRLIKGYTQGYKWIENEEKVDAYDDDYILVKDGWRSSDFGMVQVGLGAEKVISNFHLSGSGDLFFLNNSMYVNGQVKAQMFPFDGSRTHVFATVGVGTAPQTELLDSSQPTGFDKLNTFVAGGLMYFFNRHLAGSLTGTWYTMYNSRTIRTGSTVDYSTYTSSSTSYMNRFYIQAQAVILF